MRWHLPLLALCSPLLFFGLAEGALFAAGVGAPLRRTRPLRGLLSERVRVFELDAKGEAYETASSAQPTINPSAFWVALASLRRR